MPKDILEKYFYPELVTKAQEQNPFLKLNELVYKLLATAILTSGLPPGTRLNIVRIAQLLNVSRTPVADAMDQLVKEGLVVTSPTRKGHYVFDLSHSSLEQLFMARKALEGTAAYICARQNTLVELGEMKQLAERFAQVFETGDFEHFSELDQDFHNLVITSCRNTYITKMYSVLKQFISYYSIRSQEYMLSLHGDPSLAILSCQHMSIYRAIELGLPDMAESASKAHLDTCYNFCMRYHTTQGNIL